MTGSCKASTSVLTSPAKTSVSRITCHESTSESIDKFKIFEKRPNSVMTLIQLFLVLSLAQLSSAVPPPPEKSYQFDGVQTQTPPGTLANLIQGYMFEVPSEDNSESLLVAVSLFAGLAPYTCDVTVYAPQFVNTTGVKGTSFNLASLGVPTFAFCGSEEYDRTVIFQQLQKKLIGLFTNAPGLTSEGLGVATVDTSTGTVSTPAITAGYTGTDILDLPLTDKIFVFNREDFSYQTVKVGADGTLTTEASGTLTSLPANPVLMAMAVSDQKYVLISVAEVDPTSGLLSSNLYILKYGNLNADPLNALPEIILTQPLAAAVAITVSNTNSDHIYCTLRKSDDTYAVAAFSVSTMPATPGGTLEDTIIILEGTYAPLTAYRKFFNFGTLNYLVGVSDLEEDRVYLYAKTLAGFAQDPPIQHILLPTDSDIDSGIDRAFMKISPASTYGVFDVPDPLAPTSTISRLIYHPAANFKAAIVRTSLISCLADTPYYITDTGTCTGLTSTTDPYYIDEDAKAWIPCATSSCLTCSSTAYHYCDVCATRTPPFSLVGGECFTCDVDNCAITYPNGDPITSCTANDECGTCDAGYLEPDCVDCDSKAGYSDVNDDGVCRQTCFEGCTTCVRTDGDTCEDCDNPGLSGATCGTCGAAGGYSIQGGVCSPDCDVSNCDVCANSNDCGTCSEPWDGSDCQDCMGGTTKQASGFCEYDCTSPIANCEYCNSDGITCKSCSGNFADSDACDTCKVGWASPGCTECDVNFIGDLCDACINKWELPNCNTCPKPFGGPNCDECATANYDYASDCVNCVNQYNSTDTCRTCKTGWNPASNCYTCLGNYQTTTDPDVCDACINQYTLGSSCVECEPNWSSEFKCAECELNYEKSSSCQACTGGYILDESCLECNDALWTGDNCDICIGNYDTNTKCTSCINRYRFTDQCNSCEDKWDLDSLCTVCSGKYDTETECTSCIDNYDYETGCTKCNIGWTGDKCDVCDTNYGPPNVCNICINKFDLANGCKTCLEGWSDSIECTTCKENYDFADDCNSCIDEYTLSSKCQECDTPNKDLFFGCTKCNLLALEPDCLECHPNANIADGCATCKDFYNPATNCVDCLPNYDIDDGCKSCQNHFSLTSDCKTCKENWDIGTDCKTCVDLYDEDDDCLLCHDNTNDGCKSCINNYDPEDKCRSCLYNFDAESECTSCLPNFDRENDCKTCLPNYKLTDTNTCVKCAIKDCLQCDTPDVCSKCSAGLGPNASGSQCLPIADLCKVVIPDCAACASLTTCTTCRENYALVSSKGTQCYFICDVKNCATCSGIDVCKTCAAGYVPSADGSVCLDIAVEIIKPAVDYTTYDPLEETASVQFQEIVTGMNLDTFTYTLVDKITGKESNCNLCRAEKSTKNFKVIKFFVDSDIEIVSGKLKVTYPLNKQTKKSSRVLESVDSTETVIIDDIYLSGRAGGEKTHFTNTKNSFIAFNSIRFFGLFFMGFLNSIQAFWPTSLFSWLQVWSLFRGPFLAYLERFTIWHREWYLLVINFGEPFAGSFVDWNSEGKVCTAGNEYPFNRLGCSLTDNFGQNFIVILFILLFCLIVSVTLAYFTIYKKRSNKNEATQSSFASQFTYKTGLIFFMRFMNAIQPSLCIWGLLHFDTHIKSANMTLGMILSIIFALYCFTVLFLTLKLSTRIWNHCKTAPNDSELDTCDKISSKVGGWLTCLSFQYNTLKRPTAYYQLLNPLVEAIRVLVVCLLVVGIENPKVGLSLILILESVRLCYRAALYKVMLSWVYYGEELLFSGVFFFYVASKLGAANRIVSESALQKRTGPFLAFLIVLVWFTCLLSIIWDIYVKVKEYRSGDKQVKAKIYEETERNINESPATVNMIEYQEGDNKSPDARRQKVDIDENTYPQATQTNLVKSSERNRGTGGSVDDELDEGVEGVYKPNSKKDQMPVYGGSQNNLKNGGITVEGSSYI